jgi:hypothetical protein
MGAFYVDSEIRGAADSRSCEKGETNWQFRRREGKTHKTDMKKFIFTTKGTQFENLSTTHRKN